MDFARIDIPADIMESARLSETELKQELAIALYAQGRLSIGKAHELAALPLSRFRQLLGSRRITTHFDEAELAQDLAALEHMHRQR